MVLNEGQPQVGVNFRKTGLYRVYMKEARLLSLSLAVVVNQVDESEGCYMCC